MFSSFCLPDKADIGLGLNDQLVCLSTIITN